MIYCPPILGFPTVGGGIKECRKEGEGGGEALTIYSYRERSKVVYFHL